MVWWESAASSEIRRCARQLFWIKKEADPFHAAPRNPEYVDRWGARARGKSILIVDDVVDVTEMIGLFLKHAGFDVTTANSADRALRLTADTHFDLIISDIGMPEMNGYELAQSLRTRTDYVETPLIAVTGYTEYDDRGRSLEAGFNAHLTKPINPSQLLEIVSELLG